MYYINLYEIFLLASNIYIFTSCVKLNCRQLIGSDNCDANMKWGPLLCWWNTFYCTVRKTMLSYCSVVVILMMAVGYSDGGCHVNDWWVFFWTQFNYFIHAKLCTATYVYHWMQKYVVLCKNAIKLMLFINFKHFWMHMYKLPTNAIIFKLYIRTNFAYPGWRIFTKKILIQT